MIHKLTANLVEWVIYLLTKLAERILENPMDDQLRRVFNESNDEQRRLR